MAGEGRQVGSSNDPTDDCGDNWQVKATMNESGHDLLPSIHLVLMSVSSVSLCFSEGPVM